MQHPLQISARDLALSPVARARVERLAGKLETFYDRITSCHVVIEVAQRYPAGGPIAYNVRLDLGVPGEEIVVRRQPHRELETAIQNAFDVAGRRLQDYVRRRHRAFDRLAVGTRIPFAEEAGEAGPQASPTAAPRGGRPRAPAGPVSG